MGQAASVVGLLLDYCGNLDTVLIRTILGWLTPIDQDFGPFAVELRSTSVEDDDDTHIDLKEFNIEGVGLHGTVSADIPGLGRQQLPINLALGMNKSMESRACTVQVRSFDFDANDHADAAEDAEVRNRDLLGDLSGMVGGLVGGGLLAAFKQILQMDMINSWVCQQVSDKINEQIEKRVNGGGEDSSSSSGED